MRDRLLYAGLTFALIALAFVAGGAVGARRGAISAMRLMGAMAKARASAQPPRPAPPPFLGGLGAGAIAPTATEPAEPKQRTHYKGGRVVGREVQDPATGEWKPEPIENEEGEKK